MRNAIRWGHTSLLPALNLSFGMFYNHNLITFPNALHDLLNSDININMENTNESK